MTGGDVLADRRTTYRQMRPP